MRRGRQWVKCVRWRGVLEKEKVERGGVIRDGFLEEMVFEQILCEGRGLLFRLREVFQYLDSFWFLVRCFSIWIVFWILVELFVCLMVFDRVIKVVGKVGRGCRGFGDVRGGLGRRGWGLYQGCSRIDFFFSFYIWELSEFVCFICVFRVFFLGIIEQVWKAVLRLLRVQRKYVICFNYYNFVRNVITFFSKRGFLMYKRLRNISQLYSWSAGGR